VKKDIHHQLGLQLRSLRERRHLTQEKLAGLSGISLKYIQSLEGKTPKNPSLEILQKLAKGFEVPLWKLLRWDD